MNVAEQIRELNKDKRTPIEKEVDKILRYKSTDTRARAAIELWLKINPPVADPRFEPGKAPKIPAKVAHKLLLEDIKKDKVEAKSDYGVNETGSMRVAVRMLPEMLHFIRLFHPDLLDGDVADQKKRASKLVKAFPEYSVARAW